MASGKIHAKTSRRIGIIGFIAILLLGINNFALSLSFLFGARTGVYLLPDLDVNRKVHANYLLIKQHSIFGKVWYWYWKPYALLIKHRSWVSHPLGNGGPRGPLSLPIRLTIPTAVRLFYMFWWLVPFSPAILEFFVPDYTVQLIELSYMFIFWCFGLWMSDIGHAFYDSKFMRWVLSFGK